MSEGWEFKCYQKLCWAWRRRVDAAVIAVRRREAAGCPHFHVKLHQTSARDSRHHSFVDQRNILTSEMSLCSPYVQISLVAGFVAMAFDETKTEEPYPRQAVDLSFSRGTKPLWALMACMR